MSEHLSKETGDRECGACGRWIPAGGSSSCGLDHEPLPTERSTAETNTGVATAEYGARTSVSGDSGNNAGSTPAPGSLHAEQVLDRKPHEPSEFGPVDLHESEITTLRSHEPKEHLTFDAFRAANVARCVKWHPQGITSWSPSDWLTAVTGELGELASLLKMRNRERDGLPGNKFSPSDKQVSDELADVLTYLDLLAAALGVDLGRAAVEKFNEVSARVGFPDRIELRPPHETEVNCGVCDTHDYCRNIRGICRHAPPPQSQNTGESR